MKYATSIAIVASFLKLSIVKFLVFSILISSLAYGQDFKSEVLDRWKSINQNSQLELERQEKQAEIDRKNWKIRELEWDIRSQKLELDTQKLANETKSEKSIFELMAEHHQEREREKAEEARQHEIYTKEKQQSDFKSNLVILALLSAVVFLSFKESKKMKQDLENSSTNNHGMLIMIFAIILSIFTYFYSDGIGIRTNILEEITQGHLFHRYINDAYWDDFIPKKWVIFTSIIIFLYGFLVKKKIVRDIFLKSIKEKDSSKID